MSHCTPLPIYTHARAREHYVPPTRVYIYIYINVQKCIYSIVRVGVKRRFHAADRTAAAAAVDVNNPLLNFFADTNDYIMYNNKQEVSRSTKATAMRGRGVGIRALMLFERMSSPSGRRRRAVSTSSYRAPPPRTRAFNHI